MWTALSALGSSLYGYGSSALGWLGSNIGTVGSILGGLGGAFGSLLGGSISSSKQTKASKSLARYQYKLQRRGLLEFPSAQRQGLINAGYNPMLALTNGTASFSGGSQSASMPNIDIAGSAKELSGVIQDIANSKAKREKELEEQVIEGKKLENKNLDTQNKLQEANIRNIEADTQLKGSATLRNDVGVGTDIANAVGHVVGAGSSAFTAKKINDAFKKGKPKKLIKASAPAVTSSAKSVAEEVAKSLMLLTPAALSGSVVGAGMVPVRKREIETHEKKAKDKSRKWYHNFDRLHFDY